MLKDLVFPADKHNIIKYIQQKQSSVPETNEVLSVLQQIVERDYVNVADVTEAAGLDEG